jgi:alpha-glucosidase
MLIAKNDKNLLNNELIYKLATPSRIEKTDWIKPGQVAWDWWNGMTLTGVKFKSGINTATYKYNIDFASKYGIEYIILDAGWTNTKNMFEVNPDVDLKYLFKYGKEKNVGLILWTTWFDLDDNMQAYLDTFQTWGAKGIKVDFFNRNDQVMVEKIEQISAEGAKRNMLVDLHGIYTMTGLNRTYPNMITMEGVLGLEWNKWESGDPYTDGKFAATPRHDVTIPFIRMATGPMDYTPGAMINSNPGSYKVERMNPMSQGTRCHQLAMYPAYYSPIQMLSDEAPLYEKEPEVTSFITSVPTTWDETLPLDGSVGEFLVIARRKGDQWFISGMSNEEERSVVIDFSFLPEGKYSATIFEDGENIKQNPSSYKKRNVALSRESKETIKMAGGGGFAMSVSPVRQ